MANKTLARKWFNKLKSLDPFFEDVTFESFYLDLEDYGFDFSFEINESHTDCAMGELHSFNLYKRKTVSPEELFVATIQAFVYSSSYPSFMLSDSKRNNVIYKYIDALKAEGWTIFEHKTTDGRSLMKRAIFIK